jgi:hypothetical protein
VIQVTARLSTAPATKVPAVLLAARGVVLRVDTQANKTYGVAIQFTRRRIL